MLSINTYSYYQPVRYSDDGTFINYGSIPEELHSFEAFRTRDECEKWLENNGYEPNEYAFIKYCNDDIEGVTLLDEDGNIVPKIESLDDDEIEDIITDEVLFNAGSIDNLIQVRQSGEDMVKYVDRVYGLALDEVNDAITNIEEQNDYDFSSYFGNPDTEWYDAARDAAVERVMSWMTDENDE